MSLRAAGWRPVFFKRRLRAVVHVRQRTDTCTGFPARRKWRNNCIVQTPNLSLFARSFTTMALSDFLLALVLGLRSSFPKPDRYRYAIRSRAGSPEFRIEDINTCSKSLTPESLGGYLPCRSCRYGLPLHPTRSALSTLISELNTGPASSPVNA